MKICLASWATIFAGGEVAAERLAVGLREAGHEVVCVIGTEGELLTRLQDLRFSCHFVPTRFTDLWNFWPYYQSRRKLQRILRSERPDVVHSNCLPTHQLVSDAARRLHLPRLCHHRCYFDGKALDWLNKHGAERHVYVSRALQTSLCEASQRMARSPGEVVYDGLPLPPCPTPAERLAAKQQLQLDPQQQLVLYAGQIIERKGIVDLLQAWQTLAGKWSRQAQLVLVGEDMETGGAYRVQMENVARERGIPAQFMGFQRNIPTWLTAADIVLVPSHAEPLGNAVLEAMAHARPVVGCDVGGLPEMIAREETGLLVPAKAPEMLANAMERVLGNEALREQMGRAGRQRCEDLFSLEAHTKAMLKQYELTRTAQRTAAKSVG